VGRRLRESLAPAYASVVNAFEDASPAARQIAGVITVGFLEHRPARLGRARQ